MPFSKFSWILTIFLRNTPLVLAFPQGSGYNKGNSGVLSPPCEEAAPAMKAKTNLTMLCDFYELTMGNGYFQTGLADRICYFDVFYRSVPDKGGFAIAAGPGPGGGVHPEPVL